MGESAISWTNLTWNPVTGCSKVSPGCAHCYAETLSLKQGWSKLPWLPANAKDNVVLHPDRLDQPLRRRKPSMIFVNSMSDLFHEEIPDDYIDQVFSVMAAATWHTFQVLTKRPERMLAFTQQYRPEPLPNVWLGNSVENQYWAERRIPILAQVPAAVRFLSCEPLLKPLDLRCWLPSLSWIIVGGESGPKFRRMPHEWARDIRDQCVAAGVAFFFKQSSSYQTERGTALQEEDGRLFEWHQYPGDLAEPVYRGRS